VAYVRFTESFGFVEPLMKVTNFATGTTRTLAILPSMAMQWSPDGTRIAVHLQEGSSSGIFTISPDGGGLVQITRESGERRDNMPIWSPDSKYIAFGRQGRGFLTEGGLYDISGDVYRVPSGGGSAVNLTKDMENRGTKWPDAWR